jgi:hypothetical protein
MTESDHYSFTDVPIFLAPPARFLAGQVADFGQIPRKTHVATVSMLNAFFEYALNGKPSDLDTVAGHYESILRKPIHP